MKKVILLAFMTLSLVGCAGVLEKQEPVCTGKVMVGGQSTTVQIYAVRKVANQTQFKAGYPFNWQWVSENNFINNTCDK